MIIITGTYPPGKCGVGDYTCNLLQTKAADEWELFYSDNWSLSTFGEKKRQLKKMSSSVINLQYPSIGYGGSILPHLLCVYFSIFSSKLFSVTLHEFSQLGWKGKIAAILLLIFSHKIIFTNEYERKHASRYWPFVKRKSTIIKIYSNIKPAPVLPAIENRKYEVGYFGYIRDNKGLEEFMEVAERLKKVDSEVNMYVMGQTQASYQHYYEPILEKLTAIGVSLFLNKDADEVSEILADTKIAFLPFPDGISERRGSFLAVIQNKCLVVTRKGPFTTKAHEDICFFVSSMDEAVFFIKKLLEKDVMFYKRQQENITGFIKNELPHSWNEVASEYNDFLKD